MRFPHLERLRGVIAKSAPFRHARTLIIAILTEVDTLTIRAVMGWASLVFSGLLLTSQQPFTKDAYSIMESIGHQWLWAIVYLGYGTPTLYLVYSRIHRAKWNLFFNFYGFFLWGFYVFSICWAAGYIPPGMSLYFIVVPLLGWSIVRTAPPRRVR